jgi:hypothetical protein
MEQPWLETLKKLAEEKPLVIIRFEPHEWQSLYDSRHGVQEFTIARSHSLLEGVRAPAPCLIVGTVLEFSPLDEEEESRHLYFGLIASRSAVTTLESRIKVRRCVPIQPTSEAALLQLVSARPHARNLAHRLGSASSIVKLSPKLGSQVIERLGSIPENHGALQAVAASLSTPKTYHNAAGLQEDAVRAALNAFGLSPDDRASSLELVEGQETALARVGIIEDSVIEHDARYIPGYDLVMSDVTGRAVFEKNGERLEVITANRRPIENVFGVDLVYLNATRQNIVMLQYKMLEAERNGEETDWIYRPDAQLDDEIRRMRRFAVEHEPGPHEYRLNSAVFYLKFVKRDGSIKNGGIITPVDHYERLREDPACKGPRNGLRISYAGLAGRYLRQGAFFDLIRSGYIGAHADTTLHLKTLVDAVLNSDRAVVAAIQSRASAYEHREVGDEE